MENTNKTIDAAEQARLERNAKSKESRERKKAKLNKILDYVLSLNLGDDPNYQEIRGLVNEIKSGAKQIGIGSTTKDEVIKILIDKGKVNEVELFTAFRIGRTEMKRYTTNMLKKHAPEKRLWVDFDPESGDYTLLHTGPKAPEGWTGIVPVDLTDMEITDEDEQEEEINEEVIYDADEDDEDELE